jgi:hypothetical protein
MTLGGKLIGHPLSRGETFPSFQIKKLECRIEMRQADGSTIPKEIP